MFRLGSDVLDKARNVTQKCVIVKICLFLEDGSESQKRYSLFNLSFRFFHLLRSSFFAFLVNNVTVMNNTENVHKFYDNKITFKFNGGPIK